MTKRMLVDATHPEEVRVAIIKDNRLSDLEIETTTRKQIKGNIYLGKVSRVEQSLQAAFIDFGDDRQGFLPLNDIHEKYFPPPENRGGGKKGRGRGKKTTKAQSKAPDPQISLDADKLDTPDAVPQESPNPQRTDAAVLEAGGTADQQAATPATEPVTMDAAAMTVLPDPVDQGAEEAAAPAAELPEIPATAADAIDQDAEETAAPATELPDLRLPAADQADPDAEESATFATETPDTPPPAADPIPDEQPDADELDRKAITEKPRRSARRRPPPIQQILKRGQTVLVQVVKEARGNKGASLTTHISLAGRYSVLLPENSGGGGISRKITDNKARKHLKEILNNLEIPEHVSLIIRTAGLDRTKREILRDMNYMLRVWKKIQEKVEKSEAPCLIHGESDLIARTIRDLYTSDMEEILIEGQECYRRGKDFMRLLMPSYVKVVQPYKDPLPLFSRYQVENQIETMHNRIVQLKSGGYLVIDPTEAMVTIDINSGRATKEKDIETTAFKTNLLAAEEIARQLRLRDLGGLVVIDFIDMDDKKHNIEVEKRLKEAFKNDRARIQVGRISQFGLLELSRQRMKPAFSESNRQECPRCKGLGTIRAVESSAIYLFRCIEEDIAKGDADRLVYHAPQEVVNYLFNSKRSQLVNLEQGNNVSIVIHGDPEMETPEFRREKPDFHKKKEQNQKSSQNHKPAPKKQEQRQEKREEKKEPNKVEEKAETAASTDNSVPDQGGDGEESPAQPRKKRRRRRRRRRSNQDQGANGQEQQADNTQPQGATPPAQENDATTQTAQGVQAGESNETDTKEAIPTTVPGIYVLPESSDSAEKSEAAPPPSEPAATGGTSESEESQTTEKRPRRRRRRRRRSSAKTQNPNQDGQDNQNRDDGGQPSTQSDGGEPAAANAQDRQSQEA